jgi:hypothetical protein
VTDPDALLDEAAVARWIASDRAELAPQSRPDRGLLRGERHSDSGADDEHDG